MLAIRLFRFSFQWVYSKEIMAERERFELSLRVSVNTISNRAPSATRPPLRMIFETMHLHIHNFHKTQGKSSISNVFRQ